MAHVSNKLPVWFRVLFVVTLLLLCAFLCWYAPAQVQLRFQVDDVTLSLETSRQREAKQQYEYDEVVAQLPVTLAQVEELTPQAEAAQAVEAELREQRKTLRADIASLTEQLDAAQAEAAALAQQAETLQLEVNELADRQAALLDMLEAYQEALGIDP